MEWIMLILAVIRAAQTLWPIIEEILGLIKQLRSPTEKRVYRRRLTEVLREHNKTKFSDIQRCGSELSALVSDLKSRLGKS